jgi:hypothetical protein
MRAIVSTAARSSGDTGHYGMVEGALIANGVALIAAVCRGRA